MNFFKVFAKHYEFFKSVSKHYEFFHIVFDKHYEFFHSVWFDKNPPFYFSPFITIIFSGKKKLIEGPGPSFYFLLFFYIK